MARKVSREVLVGFIDEARNYLGAIRAGLDAFSKDTNHHESIEEAHRFIHTIKGASSLVGLSNLSHIAYHLEEAVDDIVAGKLSGDAKAFSVMHSTVDAIETYLEGILQGTVQEQPLVNQVVNAYRRLRGMAELAEPPPGPSAAAPHLAQAPPMPEEPEAPPEPESFAEEEPGAPPLPEEPERDSDEPANVPAELLEAFAVEADDHLRNISAQLNALDGQRDNRDLLQGVRRSVHTFKGAAGVVGFGDLANLAHRMEDLLDLLFEGTLRLDDEKMQLLFASADTLEDLTARRGDRKALLAAAREQMQRYAELMREGGQAPSQDIVPSAGSHAAAAGGDMVIDLEGFGARETPEPELPPEVGDEGGEPAPRGAQPAGNVIRVPIERLDDLVKLASELVIARTAIDQRMSELSAELEEFRSSADRLRRVSSTMEREFEVIALGGSKALKGMTANQDVVRVAAGGGAVPGPSVVTKDTYGFDALEFDVYTEFHMASRELAETGSDLTAVGNGMYNVLGDLSTLLGRESRLTSELQDKLMRVRMVPLATLTTRLHRTVRVVANKQAKKVDLKVTGQDLELDKTVLEEIIDPLLHLLRNAVDHGIEPPALRRVTGKPERGTISLRAYYEGTQVIIQVSDDGAGLDPDKLRSTAVKNGFLEAGQAAAMTEEELHQLIFLPGFSTATEVTEISGRGVGMDIVKANITKLKGNVYVDSQRGRGVSFTIRLPRTLAITQALLVKAQGHVFAVPLTAVTQILRIKLSEAERVGNKPVVRFEGEVFPLHDLADVLSLSTAQTEKPEYVPVLILGVGQRRIALEVDELVASQEIVIKPLGNHLRRVRGIIGATIMGDGSVLLILNPPDLFGDIQPQERALRGAGSASLASTPAVAPRREQERWTIMVVDDSLSVRRVLSSVVEAAGWKVLAAKDGMDALEILGAQETLPNVILMDIEMPRMDGYELTSTLKANPAYRGIPIIMITSRAGDKHRQKAMDLGVDDYVVKPFQSDALTEAVRRLGNRSGHN